MARTGKVHDTGVIGFHEDAVKLASGFFSPRAFSVAMARFELRGPPLCKRVMVRFLGRDA